MPDTATTILLVRHGETEWNRKKIFRGTIDVPLNDAGRAQARMLAEALKSRQIDAAFSSPLQRAVKTTEIALAGRGIDVQIDERLRDFCYGEWCGLAETEVAERWPDELTLWTTQPEKARPRGGGTLQEIRDTAFSAMEEIASNYPGRTVALFAHRVVNKVLVLAALGLGLERFPLIRQDNCCLNEFERTDKGYIVVLLNDTGHVRRTGGDVLNADF